MGIGAGPANAARIANYGYDWKAAPFYDDYADLFDASVRSAYYQELMGYTTMNRDRGLGENIYDKLSGADPNAYKGIHVVSHASYTPWSRIVTRTRDEDGRIGCLYSSGTYRGAHEHTVNGYKYACVGNGARLQPLTSVPNVKWIVFQGCYTGKTGADGSPSITQQSYLEGVDTATGFLSTVYFGVNPNDNGPTPNGQSRQYNFAARYWKSLYEGSTNQGSLYDAMDQVRIYNGKYWGYDSWVFWGVNGTM